MFISSGRSAGHPGTGKSSVALALAQLLRWPLIDKDDSRDCFEGIAELGEVPSGVLNSLAYKVMFRTASRQLLAGNSAIVDCPLSRIGLYQEAMIIADKVCDMPPEQTSRHQHLWHFAALIHSSLDVISA